MNGLNIGLSGIRASQTGLEIAALNLANVNTEGFHRRDVTFTERLQYSRPESGVGVDIKSIRRFRNAITETMLIRNVAQTEYTTARSGLLDRIETSFAERDGSVLDRVQEFYASMQELSARPGDSTLQGLVVSKGSQLAAQIQALTTDLTQLQMDLDIEIETALQEANVIADDLASLQVELLRRTLSGDAISSLQDRFDETATRLATYVDAVPQVGSNGHTTTRFASGGATIGFVAKPLALSTEDGKAIVIREGGNRPLQLAGGRIGGLLSIRNDTIGKLKEDLNAFARDLILAVDSVHSQGVGTAGSFDVLDGARGVDDTTAPLSEQVELPITDGSLFVSVTDEATGESRIEEIQIDVDTDSLEDLATRLSAVSGISGFVRPASGTLAIAAQPGFTFDFTGRTTTRPDVTGVTGTSEVLMSGVPEGSVNDNLTLEVTSGGTIGFADEILVDVRDGNGQLVRRLNLGKGYEPGSDIELVDGVNISFGPGELNVGDTVATEIIGTADTSGALVALGLNTFFTGHTAGNISVDQRLVDEPKQFAGSVSGSLGETRNLNVILKTRDEFLAKDGTRTLEQSLNDMNFYVGEQVADSRRDLEALEVAQEHLKSQRDAISGVDPNEELVRMMNFQRSYQAAARVISTVQSMQDELFNIL